MITFKATTIKLNKYKRIDLFILVQNTTNNGYNDMFVEYSIREVRAGFNHAKSTFIPALEKQGLTYIGRLHKLTNTVNKNYASGDYCFEVTK